MAFSFVFQDNNIIVLYCSPFSFCPLFLPYTPSSVSFKFVASLINCCHAHIHIYIHIPKYSLVSLQMIMCMHIFRDVQLVLDKQLVYTYLGKTIPPSLNTPQLPHVLCLRLRFGGLSTFTLACLLVSSFIYSCLDSHVGQIHGCSPDITTYDFYSHHYCYFLPSLFLLYLSHVFSM